MALTGLDIFKLLPKTNCKECGFPTCLAFAMQLAQKKVELSKCPHASDEAEDKIGAAAAPPIRGVTIGKDAQQLKIGEETVLYRHDAKFVNPAGVAVTLSDALDEAGRKERLDAINALKFVRVGQEIQVDLVAVIDESGNAKQFGETAEFVAANTELNIVLSSSSPASIKAALGACAVRNPLVHGANPSNIDEMVATVKPSGCPLAISAPTLEEMADLAQKAKEGGVESLVLDVTSDNVKQALEKLTTVRRACLKKDCRALGYPMMVFAKGESALDELADASVYMAKYAGVVVINVCEGPYVMPLLAVRQNIYTDPQKPIQVEPKLYEVGEPGEDAPLMFTTNFSLTYYTVEGDVEASRIPAYLLAVDTEGTSVLTAYSGDKLNEKVVAKALADTKAEEKVKHRKLIIPGYVAVMSGKLEEETGWEVLVGPKESSVIPSYLKQTWNP